MTKQKLASLIDHTLLAPEAGIKSVVNLCGEAKRYHFASVCINPIYVKLSAEELAGSGVKVCTVIGFPLGAVPSGDKAEEATRAVASGADEVDMVIDIGAARDGRFNDVESD